MQKTVDHDQRRAEIVLATWRIIARRGLAGATMRQIAHEAGFANGALKPYFPTKAELLRATYEHVFARTNARIQARVESLRGIDALGAFCAEILPLDAERLDEARVVLEFWSAATKDPVARAMFEESNAEWKRWMLERCAQIDSNRSWETEVDALLTFVLGAQIPAVLTPSVNGTAGALAAQLAVQLESFADRESARN